MIILKRTEVGSQFSSNTTECLVDEEKRVPPLGRTVIGWAYDTAIHPGWGVCLGESLNPDRVLNKRTFHVLATVQDRVFSELVRKVAALTSQLFASRVFCDLTDEVKVKELRKTRVRLPTRQVPWDVTGLRHFISGIQNLTNPKAKLLFFGDEGKTLVASLKALEGTDVRANDSPAVSALGYAISGALTYAHRPDGAQEQICRAGEERYLRNLYEH